MSGAGLIDKGGDLPRRAAPHRGSAMKLCLIVYYSRTGVTAKVATELARRCGAELERIEDVRPRGGGVGYLRSTWEALRKVPAEIAPPQHRAADYPFIVLGTPVWAGQMSSPMRSYILQQREQFRRVGMFSTMEAGDGQNVLTSMAEMCNKLRVAGMSLRRADVLSGRHMDELNDFADQLAIGRSSERERSEA
jgi:flavodoxin